MYIYKYTVQFRVTFRSVTLFGGSLLGLVTFCCVRGAYVSLAVIRCIVVSLLWDVLSLFDELSGNV